MRDEIDITQPLLKINKEEDVISCESFKENETIVSRDTFDKLNI